MRREKLEKMALYQKAITIFDIVDRIVDLVPEENDYLTDVARFMQADALQLAPKIAGAEGAGLYDLRMENAGGNSKMCLRDLRAVQRFYSRRFHGCRIPGTAKIGN